MRYSKEEMEQLARKFLDGTEAAPTLAETDPTTVNKGKVGLFKNKLSLS